MNQKRFPILIAFSVLFIASLLALSVPQPARAAGPWYVKPGAAGGCTTWADACDLQTALGLANSGDQVWAAAGVYKPGASGARTATFTLESGVEVYGGFAGTETLLSQRNWTTNLTVLSGDIDGNDTTTNGVCVSYSGISGSNSYHVVTGGGAASTARLDGFTITCGLADGGSPNNRGGGMYNASSSPTLANLTFQGSLTGGSFTGGGGMYNTNSSPSLTNVSFINNYGFNGGGLYNTLNSNASLTNVIFTGNAAGVGGGMDSAGSNPVLNNVIFYGNSASSIGFGGGMYIVGGSPSLTNVTFYGNTSSWLGGGIYNDGGSPIVKNTILWGNTAPSGGPQIYNGSGSLTVTYSDIQGGYAGTGNINADPLFVSAPGNLRLGAGSPAIDTGTNTGCPATDLDGQPRPSDGNGDMTATCDMGAYEVQGTLWLAAPSAVGSGNCTTWANACTLQTALGLANSGDQVWVAAGVYKPGASGARTDTFTLESGVAVYGGFAGTETLLSQRNWTTNLTVLSGDIDSNDTTTNGVCVTTAGISGSNSYHVVTGGGAASSARLDGFTITCGQANGADPNHRGGGMYNASSSPTLANLTFQGNQAAQSGGGMSNNASSPSLTNVAFVSNSSNNYAGGMYNWGSSPTQTNAAFISNSATSGGGGMATGSGSPSLTNVIFAGNSADGGGGIYSWNPTSTPSLINVTFYGNLASYGGGIYSDGSAATTVKNTILWGNTGGQIFNNSGGTTTVTYSDIQDGYTGTGNINADPLFINAAGGNLRLGAGSPAIDVGTNTGCPTADMDGQPRPSDGNGDVNAVCDMGAYEARGLTLFAAPSAVGSGTCANWADACTLQTALGQALSGDQIVVKAGVHKPGASGDRAATFTLKSGVTVYGGFAGTETALAQRNWTANLTVLSGDIDGNDTVTNGVCLTTAGLSGSNSYHVVTGGGADSTARLDGFTITCGWANGGGAYDNGAGMYNDTSSPSLANLILRGNRANWAGGGMYSWNASNPSLTGVSFISNLATHGGGLLNYLNSSPSLTNVAFTSNSASGGTGGGMRNDNNCNPALVNVTFTNNTASQQGGGLYNTSSSPSLTNVTFYGNTATSGGGIYNASSNPSVKNAILWGNTGGQIVNSSSTPVVTYSDIQGGYAGTGNIDADPLFIDAANGNLHVYLGSPAIDTGTDTGCPVADLDGLARPLDGDNNGAAVCDMGAYEYQLSYSGPVFYAAPSAVGNRDCSSWANACTLKTALLVAGSGDQIWAQAGVHKPTTSTTDRAATFTLESGVELYGGFAGTETLLSQRNWTANLTVLSGDIDGNDTVTNGVCLSYTGLSGSNSYHVLTGGGADSTARLDGFTITCGWANGAAPDERGGGLTNLNGNPTLANLTFQGNRATYGGALYNNYGNPSLTDVTFTNNRGADGSSVYNTHSSPSLTQVTFTGNSVSGAGGCIYNYYSDPSLNRVTFTNNTASAGGVIFNTHSNPSLTNVIFSGNTATTNGGGLINANSSSPSLTHVTLYGNTATGNGGGIYNDATSTPSVTNAILWGNTASAGAQIYNDGSAPTVTYSDVQGGYAGTGNLDADPLFVSAPGNLRVVFGSPAIDAGANTGCPATDLDGHARPLDGDNNGAAVCDMGAYELELHSGPVFYAAPSTSGSRDCSSWANVCTLQTALGLAGSGDQIWVQAGVHKPGAARTDTFTLKSGVAIYGGFAGTETLLSQRNWTANLTVLSGDIDGDDTVTNGVCVSYSGISGANNYHVVTGGGAASSARLDGFTITCGQADVPTPFTSNSSGGGMYNSASSPTLANLNFQGNLSSYTGGGISNWVSSNPSLTDVTFTNNSSGYGGGIYNNSSSPTLTGGAFTGNVATATGGGAIYNIASHPSLTGVTFTGNVATATGGGAIYNNTSHPSLSGVTFTGNSAANGSGGAIYNNTSSPTLVNVTFTSNSAIHGGGVYNTASSPSLTNCTFTNNSASSYGGGLHNYNNSAPSLTNVVFAGNSAVFGGGVYNNLNNNGSNVSLTNVTLYGNSASTKGGGIYSFNSAAPTLTNAILWGNTAPAGAQISSDSSAPVVTYSDVQGGYAGTGNIDADPLFASAPGNLHLISGSPAIDTGTNTGCPATDLDGLSRPMDGNGDATAACDMGAYEYVQVWYVDDTATGLNNGSSWTDAFTDLQSALTASGTGDWIWVAAGTYKPGASGARSATFTLKSGVEIYGQFAGTETLLSQRSLTGNITILSGDLDSSGTRNSNDAYHVVTGGGADSTARLDGFNITGGLADGTAPDDRGGGLYNINSSPTLANLTFQNNQATYGGGSIYNNASSPSLTYVSVVNSSAARGGGMLNENNSSPILLNVSLISNSATTSGGGVYNDSSSPSFTNAIIANNTATTDGGGIYNTASSPNLTNASFSGNSAGANGGGLANYAASNPTLTNAILWGNTAATGAQIYDNASAPTVTYSDIQGGYAGTGNINADPLFLGAFNLRLGASSPATDAGTNTGCPATDFRGLARTDLGCDMGAYETLLSDFTSISKSIQSGQTYGFGPTLAKLVVTTAGTCTSITIERVEANHPNANGVVNFQTGVYWNITPTPAGCTGFTGSLLLPALYITPDSQDKLCRWSSGWDCGTANTPTMQTLLSGAQAYIQRDGVTAFSPWTVGNNTGPTSITLRSLTATAPKAAWQPAALLGLLLVAGLALLRRRRA